MSENHIDELSGVETTGHEWDGIRELNNPMPRWWVWTFYVTILWAIGYAIAYPAIPMITSATKKNSDANATITNTMMVVTTVSRRVGQMTLAVSLRTSCRNLNGLKAIVGNPRPP